MRSDNQKKGLENKPLSNAIQNKKEDLYSKINVSIKTMDIIIALAVGALAAVFILIALEAAGIFAL